MELKKIASLAEETRMNGYSLSLHDSHFVTPSMLWFDQPRDSQTHPNQAEMAQPGLFAKRSMTISAIRSAMMGSPSSPYSRITQANSWKHETCMVALPKIKSKLFLDQHVMKNKSILLSSLVHSCNHCHAGIPTCWFIRRSKSESCHGWFSTFDTSLAWQVALKTCEKTFETWNVSCGTYWLMAYQDTSPRLQCLIYAKAPMAIVQLRTWNTQVDQEAILRCPVLRCDLYGAESFPNKKNDVFICWTFLFRSGFFFPLVCPFGGGSDIYIYIHTNIS